MMKTATVCAAILLAFAIAGVAPARDQQGKLDLIIRGGHVIDPRNGINSLMTGAYLYVGDGARSQAEANRAAPARERRAHRVDRQWDEF